MVHLLAKNTLVIFPNNKIPIISVQEWYNGENKKKKKVKEKIYTPHCRPRPSIESGENYHHNFPGQAKDDEEEEELKKKKKIK